MEPVPDSQQSAEASGSEDPPKNEAETEAELLLSRAQKIIDKIMANHSNPRPNLFHALASMMETQESRFGFPSISLIILFLAARICI